MYRNPRCKIVNSSVFSEFWGKQGCPLSPYYSESKCKLLKSDQTTTIKGLEIQGLKTKVSMYASDSSSLLSPQTRSLQYLFEELFWTLD